MKYLLTLMLTLLPALTANAQIEEAREPKVCPNDAETLVQVTPNGTAPQAVPHPQAAQVWYRDVHRICPRATLQQVDVPHPYLPDQITTVQFYGPNWQPLVRQYPHKIVYDYGAHAVEVQYHRNALVVDYNGPRTRPAFVGIGGIGFYSYW